MSKDVIERLKRDGAKAELKRSIESLLSELSGRNWSDIESDGIYIRLGEAIKDAKQILSQIEERLEAVNEIDGESI